MAAPYCCCQLRRPGLCGAFAASKVLAGWVPCCHGNGYTPSTRNVLVFLRGRHWPATLWGGGGGAGGDAFSFQNFAKESLASLLASGYHTTRLPPLGWPDTRCGFRLQVE